MRSIRTGAATHGEQRFTDRHPPQESEAGQRGEEERRRIMQLGEAVRAIMVQMSANPG